MTENNSVDLAANVLHTLRWYLAEQKCLVEDNWSLYYEFSSIFPPTPPINGSPMPTVHEHRTPMTIEHLLQWLSQIFNTKSLLVEAYKEFFYKNTPAAIGKVRLEPNTPNLYGDMAQTLRDFVTRQEPYVQAVRESANAIARIAPPFTAAPPVARHVLRYANTPAPTHAYVERFLERLMDNLDAEHSLDTAHVAYCSLVYQPRICLAADPQHPPGQPRRFWFAPGTPAAIHGRSEEKGRPRGPQPVQVLRLLYANELPPGTRMAIVQRGDVQQRQQHQHQHQHQQQQQQQQQQQRQQHGTSGVGPWRS